MVSCFPSRPMPRAVVVRAALATALLVHAPLAQAQVPPVPDAAAAARGDRQANGSATHPAGVFAAPAETPLVAPRLHIRTQESSDDPPRSTFDRIWAFAEWYRNDGNPVVQEVLFRGRYHHEFARVDADEGDLDEWNLRRLRLGPRVRLFRVLTVHAEVELDPQERDPLYERLTEAYVEWAASDRLAVTVGKHSAAFTLDGSTSSRELLTIDRSNLSNNMWFPEEYMPGISVSGESAPWVYHAGVYSAGAETRELGDFSGSFFTLVALGYDAARQLGAEQAVLSGNYVYQRPDPDNTFTRRLEHVGSVTFSLDAGRWGVRADVSAAAGYLGQSNLRGVMVMPFVDITRGLQLVARYTLVSSSDANGVLLGTYENRIVEGRGDRYDELYAGANYYFYGHKLKLQTGLHVAEMDDRANDGGAYSGVSWVTGVRIGW